MPAPLLIRQPCRAGRAVLLLVAGLLAWVGGLAHAAAPATEPAVLKLRIVGGLANLTQYTHLEAPFWTRDLARLSDGRYSADIVPFDRAGVPGNDMLRLLQLGVVPFGTVLMSSLVARHPQYAAVDLPGLNPDMAALRASVAALRGPLQQALRAEQGVELLALYVYPAQVLFCRQRLRGLDDLRGRTVRVASPAQADFITALGAQPRLIPFAQVVPSMQGEALDCAVTGTMSGNTVGLHQHTTWLHPMPITWGVALFGANQAAWQALPQDLRALLLRELPRLEAAIWSSAERETAQGLACNSGSATCTSGRRGAMTLAPLSPQDDARRLEVLKEAVLPRWLERCGSPCVQLWQQTLGPARGIALPATP